MTPMMTSIRPSPIDRGGKMKWKLAVSANWTRESVSASTAQAFGALVAGGLLAGALAAGAAAAACVGSSPIRAVERPLSMASMSPPWQSRWATIPVQPVWCEAPIPAPVSPWKYSWNQQQVVPVRVGLELLVVPEHGPAAVLVVEPDGHQPAGDVLGHVAQPDLLARAGRVLDPEVVAHERIPVPAARRWPGSWSASRPGRASSSCRRTGPRSTRRARSRPTPSGRRARA